MMLEKTRKVLTKNDQAMGPEHVYFTQLEELEPLEVPDLADGEEVTQIPDLRERKLLSGVLVSVADWEDLGSPETITLTIEAGDLLSQGTVADGVFGQDS